MALSGRFFRFKKFVSIIEKEIVGSVSKLKKQDKAGTIGICFRMSNSMVG
jgi:hypothetical protein